MVEFSFVASHLLYGNNIGHYQIIMVYHINTKVLILIGNRYDYGHPKCLLPSRSEYYEILLFGSIF